MWKAIYIFGRFHFQWGVRFTMLNSRNIVRPRGRRSSNFDRKEIRYGRFGIFSRRRTKSGGGGTYTLGSVRQSVRMCVRSGFSDMAAPISCKLGTGIVHYYFLLYKFYSIYFIISLHYKLLCIKYLLSDSWLTAVHLKRY